MVTVLLRDTTGNPLGSGVVVEKAIGGFWVATNRHVIEAQSHVCVVSSDQSIRSAVVMPTVDLMYDSPLDVALLWLSGHQGSPHPVAEVLVEPLRLQDLPLVVASGYPSVMHATRKAPSYTETSGLLLPLLRQPLQGGFSLAYTAMVQKGMSGGGVFLGNRLIGLNGTHPNPLWPGQWLQADGAAVAADLNAKLDLVALGIPLSVIQRVIKAVKPQFLKRVLTSAEVQCAKTPNQSARSHVN